MDPRPVDQWVEILGSLPKSAAYAPEEVFARRIIGDFTGYEHPDGKPATRARRQSRLDHDVKELASALRAYGRLHEAPVSG